MLASDVNKLDAKQARLLQLIIDWREASKGCE